MEVTEPVDGEGAMAHPHDEPVCRFCLQPSSSGMVSPCLCRGTQRWVHVECLQLWQRAVVEDRGRDEARWCQVCRGEYSVAPPPPDHVTPALRVGAAFFLGSTGLLLHAAYSLTCLGMACTFCGVFLVLTIGMKEGVGVDAVVFPLGCSCNWLIWATALWMGFRHENDRDGAVYPLLLSRCGSTQPTPWAVGDAFAFLESMPLCVTMRPPLRIGSKHRCPSHWWPGDEALWENYHSSPT